MSLVYTPLYAGFFALMFVLLSLRVIRFRRGGYGRADHPEGWKLERAVRAHGNFSEYVPIVLILMLFMEVSDANPVWLHLTGGTILVGRLCHAIAFSTQNGVLQFRTIGTASTMTALCIGGAVNLSPLVGMVLG